jgi:hypothetical protein
MPTAHSEGCSLPVIPGLFCSHAYFNSCKLSANVWCCGLQHELLTTCVPSFKGRFCLKTDGKNSTFLKNQHFLFTSNKGSLSEGHTFTFKNSQLLLSHFETVSFESTGSLYIYACLFSRTSNQSHHTESNYITMNE